MGTHELLTTSVTGSLAHRLCRSCIRRAFAFPLWSQCQRCAAPGAPLELYVCKRCTKMMCQRCLIHADHDCFTYAIVPALDASDRLVKTCSSCDCVITVGGSCSPGQFLVVPLWALFLQGVGPQPQLPPDALHWSRYEWLEHSFDTARIGHPNAEEFFPIVKFPRGQITLFFCSQCATSPMRTCVWCNRQLIMPRTISCQRDGHLLAPCILPGDGRYHHVLARQYNAICWACFRFVKCAFGLGLFPRRMQCWICLADFVSVDNLVAANGLLACVECLHFTRGIELAPVVVA